MCPVDTIKGILLNSSIYDFGFCLLDDGTNTRYGQLRYGISFMVPLSNYVIEEIQDKPTYTYFHHYRTVNTLIDQVSLRISMEIQRRGYRALPVPASQTVKIDGLQYHGIFPHKTAAHLSGLGWIGKNGLLISLKYGPRVRLGTVLTDLPLPAKKTIIQPKCGSCRLCIQNCPAMALQGNQWHEGCTRESLVDPRACSEYMNSHFKHIGRGSVCGLCIASCPFGNKAKTD